MTTARAVHTSTLLPNGLVLIAGGQNATGYLGSAELYNPATDTFTVTGSMTTARRNHTATLLPNGLVFIAGGQNSSGTLSSAELYNPATGTNGAFTATSSMTTVRVVHTATLLPNGQVLIDGGQDNNSNSLSSAEMYTYATGTFTATGSMTTARQWHTATLLPNGMMLIAGGYNGSYLSSAELYNPATGTFTATGSMTTARYYHTATLLPNGLVLIAGGQNANKSYLQQRRALQPGHRDLHRHRQHDHGTRIANRDALAQRPGTHHRGVGTAATSAAPSCTTLPPAPSPPPAA